MNEMRRIFPVNRQRAREFDAYATMPEVLAVVRSAIRPGRRQTPDVKFLHDGHFTGYAVALSVDNDRVSIAYRVLDGVAQPRIKVFGHGEGGSLWMHCEGCDIDLPDVGLSRVLERAVQSLVDTPRRRFRVNVGSMT
ncbi:hypothetical protein [Microbacterium timonense]|uniref:hypothetical protein n=1 Tax=Microbacterium timonense TaxID=2086576 RepID=UPI0011B203BD|nr:hypothetical protein [Microbacterium timonense]